FDLIKEVRKAVDSQNRVKYEITVYRMLCAPKERADIRYAPRDRKYRRRMQQKKRQMRVRPANDDYDINI
ncbi:hypothetical protein PMAYCL1PPCAC_22365, partial [Pristionchus mayeri]